MIIKRDKALEKLIKSQGNGFVKIITGIRRCGKSYLLFSLFRRHLLKSGVPADHIIEIDLENDKFADLRRADTLGEYIRSELKGKKGKKYVLIDEIQLCKKILPPDIDLSRFDPKDRHDCYLTFYSVLSGLKTKRDVDVYVTGSNSKLLSSDVATEFRGRGQVIHLTPLSFAEYYPLKKKNAVHPLEILQEYMLFGGLPECVLAKDDLERANYLKDLYKTIYLKDIINRYKLHDETIINAVTDIVMSSVGCLTNPNKLANTLRSVSNIPCSRITVTRHLGYLENAFLISKASRFDVRGKRYVNHLSKYYAEDTGLRNARMNLRQVEFTHLMENVIYNELRRNGYSVDVGVVNSETSKEGKHVRTSSEIDFVVNRGYDRIYIQTAWRIPDEKKMEQESFSLKNTNDSFRKVIIDGNIFSAKYIDTNGIGHIGVIDFLLDPSSIEKL